MTGPPGPYGPPGYKGEKVNKILFVVTVLLKHFFTGNVLFICTNWLPSKCLITIL